MERMGLRIGVSIVVLALGAGALTQTVARGQSTAATASAPTGGLSAAARRNHRAKAASVAKTKPCAGTSGKGKDLDSSCASVAELAPSAKTSAVAWVSKRRFMG